MRIITEQLPRDSLKQGVCLTADKQCILNCAFPFLYLICTHPSCATHAAVFLKNSVGELVSVADH